MKQEEEESDYESPKSFQEDSILNIDKDQSKNSSLIIERSFGEAY